MSKWQIIGIVAFYIIGMCSAWSLGFSMGLKNRGGSANEQTTV